ncbi:hypothetical protein [Caldicellulosiruptor naganoensis]|uniref:Uncharacterized protein n=1 Tax=Caldicellulosiruptor naganoensis TaxID=29324 RepID=A0ABY7BHV5_9FIRM|nr:hypothetical protein [Caldicellulosiruptor naganoensis]WAM31631.1 hypothetical protein OTJ99_000057 [Caldicellulosiruptor naganoensis]
MALSQTGIAKTKTFDGLEVDIEKNFQVLMLFKREDFEDVGRIF